MIAVALRDLARVAGGMPNPRTILGGLAIVGSWLGVGGLAKIEWDVEHGRGPSWAQKAHDVRLDQLSAQARARRTGQSP